MHTVAPLCALFFVILCVLRVHAAMDSNVPIKDAFKIADDVLRQGVKGISEIITVSWRQALHPPMPDANATSLQHANARQSHHCRGHLTTLTPRCPA